jgi:aconitate hydratase
VQIDPGSDRLQAMEPWPSWDGRDFDDLPVLIKTMGKTTTDDISPAGAWLKYRGHLERFSDNMFMGAVNAHSGATGTTRNVFTGESATVSRVARDYKARGVLWVVVGDDNYGEGSSREHAALSPRLLGCAAVIARSFARIHESNLKKQGLLALTFCDPADYDAVREGDRVSLVGLGQMAPGRPVECRVRHADAGTETVMLAHSFSAAQLEWFRKGSALNLIDTK